MKSHPASAQASVTAAIDGRRNQVGAPMDHGEMRRQGIRRPCIAKTTLCSTLPLFGEPSTRCPHLVIDDIREELRGRPYDLVGVAGGVRHLTRPAYAAEEGEGRDVTVQEGLRRLGRVSLHEGRVRLR